MTKRYIILLVVFMILIVLCLYVEQSGKVIKTNSDFIKWVDFSVTTEALKDTSKLDIESHNNSQNGPLFNWIELLAYLACYNGGNFSNYKKANLDNLVDEIREGRTMEDLTKDLKNYNYYYESYLAVLSGFIGQYSIETKDAKTGEKVFVDKYGIKAFSPLAKNYNFSHYDDFGNSRSYGFKRIHLGNDLLRKYWNTSNCSRIRNSRTYRLESVWRLESRDKEF